MSRDYAASSRYDIDQPSARPTSKGDLTEDNRVAPGASGIHIHAARRAGKTPEQLQRRVGISPELMTLGEKVCAFIEHFCVIPEGQHVGKPFILAPFQVDFILDVYDNPHGTLRAYLSMARKNGKSGLVAALLLAHIVGPLAMQNSQIVSGALSRDQAAIVFGLAAKMVALSPVLHDLVFPNPSGKSLRGMPMNTLFRALSAEAGTAHGLSPVLAILDETGQIKGPKSAFVEAVETSQGAYEHPLLLAISTQAPNDSDLFSRWIDDALTSLDPRTVCHVYSAPENADLMDEAAWAAANPGLGTIRMVGGLRSAAERALRMPSEEAGFRQLFLNQRVEARAPYVSKTVWLENGGEPDPTLDLLWYAGLDLSATTDLTAFVSVGMDDTSATPATEPRHVLSSFWTPEIGLVDRAARDRVPYDVWEKAGHLITTPGAVVDYDYVAFKVVEAVKERRYAKIAFDRWNFPAFQAALIRAGMPQQEIDTLFVPFGQGYQSMSPAMRALDTLLLNGRIRHGNHPVMAMCARNAIVLQDPAGNRKLSKTSRDKRIDGMVALVMAVGAAAADGADTPFDAAAMIG